MTEAWPLLFVLRYAPEAKCLPSRNSLEQVQGVKDKKVVSSVATSDLARMLDRVRGEIQELACHFLQLVWGWGEEDKTRAYKPGLWERVLSGIQKCEVCGKD